MSARFINKDGFANAGYLSGMPGDFLQNVAFVGFHRFDDLRLEGFLGYFLKSQDNFPGRWTRVAASL